MPFPQPDVAMTQLAPPSVSGPAFAVFRGTLSPDRVRWLFSRRSVWDRCLEFALFLLLGTGIAALFLWLSVGGYALVRALA